MDERVVDEGIPMNAERSSGRLTSPITLPRSSSDRACDPVSTTPGVVAKVCELRRQAIGASDVIRILPRHEGRGGELEAAIERRGQPRLRSKRSMRIRGSR